MNRYYLVLLNLYKKSRYKRTMKEVWGNKVYIVYGIFTGLILAVLGMMMGVFVSFFNNQIGNTISIVSYVLLIIIALVALILMRFSKNDIGQRENWLEEIDHFNDLLVLYKFGDQDIERMILYINEYRTGKTKQRKRKYDVMWGIVSVTILSFIVSIGKSIWDSYSFKGDEALQIGSLFLLASLIVTFSLLMVISAVYDLFAKVPQDEDGLKKALQEALFRRSVEMLVTTNEVSEVLIEENYRE